MGKMMRTLEVVIVIVILLGAFVVVSYFTVLPAPRTVAPINLRRLALTTLQTLDSNHDLSRASFDVDNDTTWNHLQIALSAMLPADIIYNLTILEVNSDAIGTELYTPLKSVSNAPNLGTASDASQYFVASSNVTFSVTPEQIGEHGGGGTLYILNCSDANSWWTVGYTAQTLAQDFYNLLSPYFKQTVMVQSTTELGQILDNHPLHGEVLQNAVVINTCGEAMPIPTSYYDGDPARYAWTLGQRVLAYNWTLASIVGYPIYYVSNTALFPNDKNSYGIYGMKDVGPAGLNAFLQGLDNQTYLNNSTWITASLSGVKYLTSKSMDDCNYYGIYPSPYQTFTRALPVYVTSMYNLNVTTYIFNPDGGYNPGAVYRHSTVEGGTSTFKGGFLALGLTRTPDIRVTALGLLSDYKPRIYRSDYAAYNTSRLAVLQLGLAGGA
jgi:hypothetical protein